MTESPTQERYSRPWMGLVAGIPVFAIMLLCEHLGVYEYFWATLSSVIAMSLAIWENRSFHKEVWYWISLVVFVILHVLLIAVIARYKILTNVHGPDARGLLGLTLVDFAIMTAVIRFPDWVISSLTWFFGDPKAEGSVAK